MQKKADLTEIMRSAGTRNGPSSTFTSSNDYLYIMDPIGFQVKIQIFFVLLYMIPTPPVTCNA